MKTVLLSLLLILPFGLVAQDEDVRLISEQSSVLVGDSLDFSIWSNTNVMLQVYVLTGDSLLFNQNVHAAYNVLPFHISTTGWPLGDYYVLITGSDVHIEKEFLLWKEE